MAKTVGIPRGLFYYQFYPLWKTFFEEIGAEIAVSDRTTKRILDSGVKSCVDEACLPVKLFHGHIINLKDRVDYLFIPRFTSISRKEYICPKFGGLPDMVRSTIKGLPEIIDTEVNLRESGKNAFKAALQTGFYFCTSRSKIAKAFEKAVCSYRKYRDEVKSGKLPCEVLEEAGRSCWRPEAVNRKPDAKKPVLNIAVIGHVYNLYDNYINMNMLNKLRNHGANIITPDMVEGRIIKEESGSLPKRMFWNFGSKAVGSALHVLKRVDLDGIIYVMSFGCGIDSFVSDLIERKVRRNGDIPFIVLTIDEHSGEAGLDTRLEAFIDMLRWRRS